MVDPIVEVDRLKHSLRMAGLPITEVDEIGNLATQDIDSVVYQLVDVYMDRARDIVSQLGGQQLANEIRSVKRGPQFVITTDSGITDFSAPPFEMLPHLLKNGKIASDGSTYKVIPLSPRPQRTLTNIFDVYKDHNVNARKAQEDRNQKWEDMRASNAIERKSLSFSGLAQAKRYLAKRQKANNEKSTASGGEVEFRTASSKQDPSQSWVIPAKDMDITNILNDINNQLEDETNSAIMFIINEYRSLL